MKKGVVFILGVAAAAALVHVLENPQPKGINP